MGLPFYSKRIAGCLLFILPKWPQKNAESAKNKKLSLRLLSNHSFKHLSLSFLRFFALLCGYPFEFEGKYLGFTQLGGC